MSEVEECQPSKSWNGCANLNSILLEVKKYAKELDIEWYAACALHHNSE
jgi:hypothetical protein